MNEFRELEIGHPDFKRADQINLIYSEICTLSSCLVWNLETYLSLEDSITLDVFLDFLKCTDPNYFLYAKWIEVKKIEFLGLNTDKIIQAGLVDVPKDKFAELIRDRAELLSQLEKTKSVNYFYPIARLWDSETRCFAITSQDVDVLSKEFDSRLFRAVRTFTTSQKENQMIDAIQKVVTSLNGLISIGLLPNDCHRWKTAGLVNLFLAIEFNEGDDNPLSIRPELTRLKNNPYFSKFLGERTTIEPIYKMKDLFSISVNEVC
jgi:hypothetical protein